MIFDIVVFVDWIVETDKCRDVRFWQFLLIEEMTFDDVYEQRDNSVRAVWYVFDDVILFFEFFDIYGCVFKYWQIEKDHAEQR